MAARVGRGSAAAPYRRGGAGPGLAGRGWGWDLRAGRGTRGGACRTPVRGCGRPGRGGSDGRCGAGQGRRMDPADVLAVTVMSGRSEPYTVTDPAEEWTSTVPVASAAMVKVTDPANARTRAVWPA